MSEHVASPPCTRGHIRESSLRAATSRANSPLDARRLSARVRSDLVRDARHGVRVAQLRPGNLDRALFGTAPRSRKREANVAKGAAPWRRCSTAPPRVARARFAPAAPPYPRRVFPRRRRRRVRRGETAAPPTPTTRRRRRRATMMRPLVPRTFAAIDEIVARAPRWKPRPPSPPRSRRSSTPPNPSRGTNAPRTAPSDIRRRSATSTPRPSTATSATLPTRFEPQLRLDVLLVPRRLPRRRRLRPRLALGRHTGAAAGDGKHAAMRRRGRRAARRRGGGRTRRPRRRFLLQLPHHRRRRGRPRRRRRRRG